MADVYSPSPILVFCNVSADGKIVEAEIGQRIIPGKQYDYFFTCEDSEILETPDKFIVENGTLTKINLI